MAAGQGDFKARLDALIAGPTVTAATRAVLRERIARAAADAGATSADAYFFTAAEFDGLAAACACVLPPRSSVTAAAVALSIDARLAGGSGPGWRYDAMPGDGVAYRLGLAALDAAAMQSAGGGTFARLDPACRSGLLQAAGRGLDWPEIDSRRWLETLLVDVTAAHVAHPATQLQMGATPFADAEPWQQPAKAAPKTMFVAQADPKPPPLPQQRHACNDVVDAVVIGTGAGGGPLLWRLARAGLSVVALEAGRHWDPAVDFATDEKAQEALFWTDERLSAGADPLAFGSNNSGLGVGGSTLHFTAYTPRPQPDDLRLFSEFGVGVDWPIGHEALAPYFDELEALVGISGPSPYPWGPARTGGYPLPPLPLNAAARLMQRGCDALGLRSSPAANAALSQDYAAPGQALRHACTQRGFCQAGCSTGAKGSVDVVFIPPALAHGAELRTGCFATVIERDATGRVCGVVYRQGGRELRQRCRNVFLCAGGIETPRLLLANGGLANGSGQVGRNFMAHVGLQLWARFDAPTLPWRGIPGGLICEDTHRSKDADFAGGYLLQSIGVMPLTYATQLARSGQNLFGAALGDHLAHYGSVAGINVLGECLPSAANFLELSSEVDARGLPKPRIYFTAGENERRMNAHAERTMRAIWQAAGAIEPWAFERYAHIIGTCRMGHDDDSSVVDADGRAHGVPGLFVCDNSVFPSALSVNPALTIMALSLRTADRFLAQHNHTA